MENQLNLKPQKNNFYCIFGKKGSGKTTLCKKLIKENTKRKNLIIWDFLGEYGDFGFVFPDKKSVIIHLEKNECIKGIIREIDFEWICNVIWYLEDCLFIVEECDSICSSAYIPEPLSKLIRYGRHKGIDMIFISRRPADVHRLITSQADLMCIYRFTEPRDLDYIEKTCRCDTKDIQELKDYEYYQKEL